MQPDDLGGALEQHLLGLLELWLARHLSYHPWADEIETVREGEQLELHLRGKVLAVVTVSVEPVVGSAP